MMYLKTLNYSKGEDPEDGSGFVLEVPSNEIRRGINIAE
jgi:hypothetical protein